MPTSPSASRPLTESRRCRCSARRNTRCACLSIPTRFPSADWGWTRWSSAIQGANSNLPSGSLQGKARTYTVRSDGKLERAADFNSLIIAYKDGMPVRFADIGRAEDGVENEKIRSWHNGERALILAIYRQPGSNTVEVVSQLREHAARDRA